MGYNAFYSFITILFVSVCMVSSANNATSATPNATYLPALEDYLYHGSDPDSEYYYDSSVRPNLFSPLTIYAQFYLLSVGGVDEKKGYITPSGLLILQWNDSRLTWNPEEFGNISSAFFDSQYKIWIPQFLHNGMFYVATDDALMGAEVHHNGNVTALLAINEETPCTFDMSDFPRDTQNCHIYLMHVDYLVKFIAVGSGDFDMLRKHKDKALQHNVAWEIKNVSMIQDKRMMDAYEFLSISITMKRHASFFLRIYVTPVCFLLLLIPIIFLLPPDSSEKLTFGAVLLFCMIYVSQSLEAIYPPYTDSMPYLIKLTTASGALLFLCILLTSLISSVERIGRKKAVPAWMKKYIIGVMGKYLLVNEADDGSSHGTVHITPSEGSDKTFIVQSEQSVDLSDNNGAAITNSVQAVTETLIPPGEESVKEAARQCIKLCFSLLLSPRLKNFGVFLTRPLQTNQSSDVNQTLHSLVNELKYSRLQNKAQDDWTNLFTIINRFLFFLTLLIGIVIILCFA